MRSKIEFLRDPFNFQKISRLEVEVSVGLVDVDASSGVLRKKVPDRDIDEGDDGPQAHGIPAVGLIGGKLADLFGSGQGWQAGRSLALIPWPPGRGQHQHHKDAGTAPRM